VLVGVVVNEEFACGDDLLESNLSKNQTLERTNFGFSNVSSLFSFKLRV